MGRERNKVTSTGPLFINRYTPVNRSAVQTVASGETDVFTADQYGATGARFVQVQIVGSDNYDVLVEAGASGAVSNPGVGSMRIGKNYGMPMIQIPIDLGQIKVSPDTQAPTSDATVSYTVVFID